MGVKSSIFASNAEKRLFHKLESIWKDSYDIYPQIPVKNVIEYETISKLPPRKREYLLKTEFDYVVCEKDTGRPILAIEFDGIGHGFSKDGKYQSKTPRLKDPHRKLKLDSKLSLCLYQMFPLVIVSWEEIEPILDDEDSLTILDEIIGQVIAQEKFLQGLPKLAEEHAYLIKEDIAGEAFQDVAMVSQIEAELEFNPIAMKAAEMFEKLPLCKPILVQPLRDREGYIGNKLSCKIKDEEIAASVYIRTVNCAGASEYSLLNHIGDYYFYKAVMKKIGADFA